MRQVYETSQPHDDTTLEHVDGYLNWVLELHNERLEHANDGAYAMAIAARINALTGEPTPDWVWEFWHWDAA